MNEMLFRFFFDTYNTAGLPSSFFPLLSHFLELKRTRERSESLKQGERNFQARARVVYIHTHTSHAGEIFVRVKYVGRAADTLIKEKLKNRAPGSAREGGKK